MFFSEAIALIEPKLCINHWKVLCVFYVDRNSKMTTTAGHSFYIVPIGSFYNQVNDTGSWEPLVLYVSKTLQIPNYLYLYYILHVQPLLFILQTTNSESIKQRIIWLANRQNWKPIRNRVQRSTQVGAIDATCRILHSAIDRRPF
jgi:hypothetical protein